MEQVLNILVLFYSRRRMCKKTINTQTKFHKLNYKSFDIKHQESFYNQCDDVKKICNKDAFKVSQVYWKSKFNNIFPKKFSTFGQMKKG